MDITKLTTRLCSSVISDCNRSIPKQIFYCHPVRNTWIFHLGLVCVLLFFKGLGEFLEWTWVNVMILYTVEEITTAHCYLKNYIDRHLFNQWIFFKSFIVTVLSAVTVLGETTVGMQWLCKCSHSSINVWGQEAFILWLSGDLKHLRAKYVTRVWMWPLFFVPRFLFSFFNVVWTLSLQVFVSDQR